MTLKKTLHDAVILAVMFAMVLCFLYGLMMAVCDTVEIWEAQGGYSSNMPVEIVKERMAYHGINYAWKGETDGIWKFERNGQVFDL